jgi:predicted nucleotidyltransferase
LEGAIYDIRKFFSLAADCNPNILDVLYAEKGDVLLASEEGTILRNHRDLFLSRAAKHRFSGYALAQLRRIQTHREWLQNPPSHAPTREEFGLRPETTLPKAQLQAVQAEIGKQLDRWNEGFVGDLEESQKIRIREGVAQLLAELKVAESDRFTQAARVIGLEENFIHYLQKEREFGAAMQRWSQYLNWKATRNADRAALEAKYGYDVKHAMHLVRLLRMCREILTGKGVQVKRPDSQELLEIRAGAWSYDRLISWAEKEDLEMNDLMQKSTLPRSANREVLDNLCSELVERFLQRPS